MPKRPVTTRISKYRAKLQPERVKQDLEQRRQEMLDAQQQAANELMTIENKVKEVLAGSPVTTVDYVKYHNFARECYREQRNIMGGYGLKKEVQILIAKYKARDCLEAVLDKIRTDVFGIDKL